MEIIKRFARWVLHDELEELYQRGERYYMQYIDAVREYSAAIKERNATVRALDKTISELRSADPLSRTLDNARHHAAQDRIRQLEREVANLEKRLHESRS